MKIPTCLLSALTFASISSGVLYGESAELGEQWAQIQEGIKFLESDEARVKTLKVELQHFSTSLQGLLEKDQFSALHDSLFRNNRWDFSVIPGLQEKMVVFEMQLKEEVARREDAQVAAGEALLGGVGEELKSAGQPEELDALLARLAAYRPGEYGNSQKLVMLHQKLQVALQIVGNWQEYLMAEESGDKNASKSNLQQIASQLATSPIFPRSMVLRLLNPATPQATENSGKAAGSAQSVNPEEIIARLTETGDTAAALTELRSVPKAEFIGVYETVLRHVQLADDLRKLEPAMVESEVFANLRSISSPLGPDSRNWLALAMDQIALNAITRNYGMEAQSAKATSSRKVLGSIATATRDQQDWPKLRKAINSIENLNGYGIQSTKRAVDLRLISLLELGAVAEQREDYESAAAAYLEASSMDGIYLQREVGYSKLADLKAKAPDKVESVLSKAEERKIRAEAARFAAEAESRRIFNESERRGPAQRPRAAELAAMRPLLEEIVAEFMQEKRQEAVPESK